MLEKWIVGPETTAAHPAAVIAFWVSFALLFFAFAGYPLLALALARCCPRPARKGAINDTPPISIVLVARNEAGRIVERLKNLDACRYPDRKKEIVVVSDTSTDETEALAESAGIAGVKVIRVPDNPGKCACLNVGIEAAGGEILVFADARQRFADDALEQLVENFNDPEVGAVSGALEIEPAAEGTGESLGVYWKLEKKLRHWESLRHSSVGCTGAIYAIRRSLFSPLPADALLDDVEIPMQVVKQGYRAVFEPRALAFDPQPLGGEKERRRKTRTLAGNFQLLFRYPSWMLPWGHRLWWRLISHKYLRIAGPALLLILLVSNVLALPVPIYAIAIAGQILFYFLGAVGLAFPRLRVRLFSWPAGFLFLNWMVLRGLMYFLFKGGKGGW